jgi:hypothetical protein
VRQLGEARVLLARESSQYFLSLGCLVNGCEVDQDPSDAQKVASTKASTHVPPDVALTISARSPMLLHSESIRSRDKLAKRREFKQGSGMQHQWQ